jgi:hypothetical protein
MALRLSRVGVALYACSALMRVAQASRQVGDKAWTNVDIAPPLCQCCCADAVASLYGNARVPIVLGCVGPCLRGRSFGQLPYGGLGLHGGLSPALARVRGRTEQQGGST